MNTLHLYGNIVDVFEGKITPSSLKPKNAGVAQPLSFGLGVSCFQHDLANIGDAVYFKGRFFIRSTDEGQKRDPLGNRFQEGQVTDYRTVYSLGITRHPMEMEQKTLKSEALCRTGFSVEDLIAGIIGPARSRGIPPRTYGFLGILDYEAIQSTSLSVAPIHGENIIPLMGKYARPSTPLPRRSGIVMGFVRDRTQSNDSEENKRLGQRLFFDNPKDNEYKLNPRASDDGLIQEPHWISHTHGVLLPSGESALPSTTDGLLEMRDDAHFCRSIIDRALGRNDYEDCGHVIPRSTLHRYFVVAFPIEQILSFPEEPRP